MSPGEILVDVRKQPFEPFRMIVTDGTTYEIHHPDQCMVLTTAVIVGMGTDPDSFTERTTKIDCRHIVRTAPLPIQRLPANGVGD